MTRRSCTALVVCALLGGFFGSQPAQADTWNQVLLFDWVYPGEPGYQALKQADTETGGNNWLTARMARGEKLPQASVRELASRLWDDARVDEATRATLKKLYTDEPQQLTTEAGELKALSNRLDESSKKLDELQASLDANRYGKGSTPAVNMDMFAAYRSDHPSGLDQADARGYMIGGLNVTLLSTLDKINFTIELDTRYSYGQDSAPAVDSTLQPFLGGGASFQIPLSDGGLEVHLADTVDIDFSPLTQSGIFPGVQDPFFVDVTTAYRGPTALKALDLDYPSATIQQRGVYIRRQGAAWYWPFSLTQLLYAPQEQALLGFTAHLNYSAARLDEDISGRWPWLDTGRFYYVFQIAANDADQMYAEQFLPGGANIQNVPQKSTSHSLGFDMHQNNWGTEVKTDYAISHYQTQTFAGADILYDDSAWIADLIQPIGTLNVALELGAAGPKFLSGPKSYDYTQPGSTIDTIANLPGFNNLGLIVDHETVGDPTNTQWFSYIKDPTILSNNSNRLALKAEWHGSWLSIGVYDGVIGQQVASNSLVMTQPYLEGHDFDGFGFYRMFGASYAAASPPGGAPYPVFGPSLGSAFEDNSLNELSTFNQVTDGQGVDAKGNTYAVHWQRLLQYSYKGSDFATILTKNGVGDDRFADDSVKTLNYAGGRLIFDLASLSGRDLPLELDIIGQIRDLADLPGVPALGPAHYFNQQVTAAFLTGAVTPAITLLGMAGYETWRSDHSFYPLNMQIDEFGIGSDWKLDSLVSGLQMNLRATDMEFQDLNIYSRGLSLLTIGVAMTLSY
jgi:hypothetical protein